MKHLLPVLLLSLTLWSCSKSNEDDEEETTKTTVNFTNKLSKPLENVIVGSWKTGPATVIKRIGTLNAGSSTGDIELADGSLGKVYIYMDEGSKTYMTPHGFMIAQGTFNNWNIDGNVSFDLIKKTDEIYPK